MFSDPWTSDTRNLTPKKAVFCELLAGHNSSGELVLSNGSIMIFKVGGELMGFVFFGYKVNEFCIGRIKGSLQGFCPWIGDGAGGEGL